MNNTKGQILLAFTKNQRTQRIYDAFALQREHLDTLCLIEELEWPFGHQNQSAAVSLVASVPEEKSWQLGCMGLDFCHWNLTSYLRQKHAIKNVEDENNN